MSEQASVPLEKFRRVCEEYDKLEQQLIQALALLDEAASIIGASSTDDYHTAEEERQDEGWMRRYNALKREERPG